MKDLKQKLKTKSKEWLIDQIDELTIADDANADRVLLKLIADGDDISTCVAKFKQQLNKAAKQISDHGVGHWNSPLSTTGFDMVADALAVIPPKNFEAVIEISEYALVKLDGVYELQEECELEYLVLAFTHLHLHACLKLKPDPSNLAKRFAKLAKQTEWGFFDGPPEGYSEVLGAKSGKKL